MRGPGHPARLHADAPGFHWNSATSAQVPAGFDLLDHPNREDADPALLDLALPTSNGGLPAVPAALREHFSHRGWALDQHGRPCTRTPASCCSTRTSACAPVSDWPTGSGNP